VASATWPEPPQTTPKAQTKKTKKKKIVGQRGWLEHPISHHPMALGGGPATPKAQTKKKKKKKKNHWPAGVVGPPPMGCQLPFFLVFIYYFKY
jgi:hypothetical protein